MRSRIVFLLPLLMIAASGITGCSHRSANVRIGIVYSGGPNPAVLAHRWQPGVVRVFRADGSFVTSRHLLEGETLSARPPAGTYRVVGHSGDAGCVPTSVTVPLGGSSVVPVVCSVK